MVRHLLRSRTLGALAACGLLLASAGLGLPQAGSGPSSGNAERAIGRKRNLKGVPNFGEVTDKLYRGGQPTAEGFEGLAHEGVGVVVDLSGNQSERDQVKKLGMEYVSIPWHCFHLEDKQVARFLRVLRDHPDQKVFVHCRLGEDRTGMMVAGYRMAEQSWTAAQARKEMAAFGFSSVHHLMCPGLATYEQNFPQRLQTSPAFDGLRLVPPPSQAQP
jgi:tyrosine-protein phosphatase SIW14